MSYRDRASWLEARRSGIGSSETAVLLGLEPRRTPFQVWADKLGHTLEEDRGAAEWLEWGLRLEPAIAAKYADETGRDLSDPGPYTLFRHQSWEWLIATPDRLVSMPSRPDGVLEIKTGSMFTRDQWTDEPPLQYQVQLQHQLMVLGRSWGSIAVLLGGSRFLWADLEADESVQTFIAERVEAFWTKHVMAGLPPDTDGSDVTRRVLAKLYPRAVKGKVVELPREAMAWDDAIRQAEQQIEDAEARKALAQNSLRMAIGEAEAGMLPSGVLWTYKTIERKAYVQAVPATSYRQLRRREP